MDENTPDLPTLVDEIKAGLQAVEQVLLLGVLQRHGHARDRSPCPARSITRISVPGGTAAVGGAPSSPAMTRWTSSVGIARPGRQSVMKEMEAELTTERTWVKSGVGDDSVSAAMASLMSPK